MSRSKLPSEVFKRVNMMNGDTSQCWPFKGPVNKKDGRPYMTINGVTKPAYVWALIAFTGEMPDGKSALHSCDNKICCNPHMLRWGTAQENSNDMKERDRHGLPKTVIRNISRLLRDGRTHDSIAQLYGCSRETITAINRDRLIEEIEDGDDPRTDPEPAVGSDDTPEQDVVDTTHNHNT